ncbi:oxidoreductase [uncultured Roseovarius sp.]|uniref:oxidoreductase n=1 Tax=uncultured Roseovarius sp. TaxID=293344 RepID=UPI00262CE00D|nr:oxidoreductase [uncultured Roseovarius sp.]
MQRRDFLIASVAAGLIGSQPVLAQSSDTILTVNDTARGTSTHFSDADLLALTQQNFATETIWTDAVRTFSGPSLQAVLDAAGANPAPLRIFAINDYSVEFPVEKIAQDTPILANRIDGERFSVRQKGPLWVIFPFDQNTEFQSEEVFALSVWQVERIDVLND